MTQHILVTGASSGIGAAIARHLDRPENRLSIGARRMDKLAEVSERAYRARLDVTDEASVEAFLEGARAANGPIDVLVNNAGLARGTEQISEATGEAWREMIETNVMGVLHLTRRVLPSMIDRGCGHLVMIGSIAGHESYEGASVYCASKRALQSIAKSLRLELHGSGVRVTLIDPGLTHTEFSLVRFSGDSEKAAKPYENTRAMSPDDIAECVGFALSRPAHVNIDSMVVLATDQIGPTRIHRNSAQGAN